NVADCLKAYGTAFQSSRGNLLLLSKNGPYQAATSAKFGISSGDISQPFDWICQRVDEVQSGQSTCDDSLLEIRRNIQEWEPFGSPVEECYSQRTDEHCQVLFSRTLCWIVTALNLLKSLLMLFVAFGGGVEKPILTIGDAVASFLEHNDESTTDMCLKGNEDFFVHNWFKEPIQFDLNPRRKSAAITSDTPQVIVSLLYFAYNSQHTTISLLTEWDRFGDNSRARGLRVSSAPRGAQRQTYFLQLPYRYSIPLICFSGSLHWLISQSLFLVNLEIYTPSNGNVSSLTACGWSPLGILCVLAVGILMIGFLVISARRRLRFGGIPVTGSCSAAISAACHPNKNEGAMWEKALQWGAVELSPLEGAPGHCSFSSHAVELPVHGQWYA
ncbi:hypothetical protein GQ607_016067, partial [Colletotrichum asianum]